MADPLSPDSIPCHAHLEEGQHSVFGHTPSPVYVYYSATVITLRLIALNHRGSTTSTLWRRNSPRTPQGPIAAAELKLSAPRGGQGVAAYRKLP
jgi:hypothetical protein